MPETRPSYSTLALRNEVTDVRGSLILSATSEASLWRKEELSSPLRSRRWRSTSNAQQQIVGQFASAIVPRQLALIDANLDTPAGDIETALGKLLIYLRAYDIAQVDNTGVASWASVGTNTAIFTQEDGGLVPTYQTVEIDGKPIVRFVADHYVDYPSGIALGTAHTIIAVLKFSSVGATGSRWVGNGTEHVRVENNVLYYTNSGGSAVSVAWTPVVSTWYTIRVVRSGLSVSFYVDGAQVGATQTLAANSVFTLRYVGLNNEFGMHGDIAEVMISTATDFESGGYALACQDFLWARYQAGTAATGLTTMAAVSSLIVEFAASSAFGAGGSRWAVQSYAQTGRRVLRWYTRAPDSVVPQATADLRADPHPIYDLVFRTSFWRLTLPAGGVLDSDGDGMVDTYHEIGVIWFGNYTELPIEFGVSVEVNDPSMVSESDAGARFIDRLPTFHEINADSEANLEAVSYALLAEVDAAGTSRHVVLDLWAPSTSLPVKSQGCYYGLLGKGKGTAAKIARKITGRDNVSFSFAEARA